MNYQQYVTLFNTTGIIEKDNNIYFLPVLNGNQVRVCDFYYTKFLSVAKVVKEEYPLSDWSPEDKRLVCAGNVEDYRNTHNGVTYLLVRRRYEDGRNSYAGFFIDNAVQVGNKSVSLFISRDNFSNYFFWDNTYTLDGKEYSPLSEMLNRTYVERQHYDRYYKDSSGKHRFLRNITFCANEEDFNFRTLKRINKFPLCYSSDGYPLLSSFDENERKIIKEAIDISALPPDIFDKVISTSINYLIIETKENILEPLFQSVGTFEAESPINCRIGTYYKYGSVKGINQSFQRIIIPIMDPPSYFSNLNINKKAIKLKIRMRYGDYEKSTAYKLLTLSEIFSYLSKNGFSDYIVSMHLQRHSSVSKSYTGAQLVFGLLTINYYIKFNETLETDENVIKYGFRTVGATFKGKNMQEVGVDKIIPLSLMPNAGYIGKGISNEEFVIPFGDKDDYYNRSLRIEDKYDINSKTFKRQISLPAPNYQENVSTSGSESNLTRSKPNIIGFLVNESEPINIKLQWNNNEAKNGEEPLLNVYPYRFHSISYMGLAEIELKDYYFMNQAESYRITFSGLATYTYNETMNLSIIPMYSIENEEPTFYFNDALSFNLTSSFPINSSSYLSYYYQNLSQMKSQYALNNIAEYANLANSPIAIARDIGAGFVKNGIPGLIAGAISSGGNTIMSGINYAFENQKITERQTATLNDIGRKPDTLKNLGTDVYKDILLGENCLYENEYAIDDISKRNISNHLSRYGYMVNRFDNVYCYNRNVFNYVKLISFDFKGYISLDFEESIRSILTNGVTLVHDPVAFKEDKPNLDTNW